MAEESFPIPFAILSKFGPKDIGTGAEEKNLLCSSSSNLPFSPFILVSGCKSSLLFCLLLSSSAASLLSSLPGSVIDPS